MVILACAIVALVASPFAALHLREVKIDTHSKFLAEFE
jgi:hypothetical protein